MINKTKAHNILKKTNVWRGVGLSVGFLLSIFVVLQVMGNNYEGFINDALHTQAPVIESNVEPVYKSKYGALNKENCAKLIEAENDFNVRAMEEGAVLIRNENNALPLASNERSVTFFGNNTADPIYATNGGGSKFKESRGGSLYNSFKSAGFSINDTMYNAYVNSGVRRTSLWDSGKENIGEVPLSFYTEDLKKSYESNYNDVAFIVLTRYAGEGLDHDTKDSSGVSALSLHKEESDMIKMVKESGKFKKIVVLVNSPFAIDLQWIEDPAYGVDACFCYGGAGDTGYIGLVNLLTGKADPSGHLVDTYASNSLSAPAIRNFGDFTYSNYTDPKGYYSKYVVYAEDIYVGYKYYETRYQDQVLNKNKATGNYGIYNSTGSTWNYADEVAYTFGYGKSYSKFTQEVESIVWDRDAHELTAKVKVTNDGSASYAGKSKSVVQLYAQLPYQAGQAEKSAIQLIGFEKTNALASGESEIVTVTVDDYLFATYDENAVNGADTSKKGCYVFDPGDYYFAIGNDAHDALNNVLANTNPTAHLTDEQGNTVTGTAAKAVKGATLASLDNNTWAKSKVTGEVVCNALQDIDYNEYKAGAVTYLTRSDWSTYPVAYDALEATEKLKTDVQGFTYVKDENNKATDYATEVDSDLKFVDMAEVTYEDDAKWDKFLDQLSWSDLATICGETMGNAAIKTVSKPANNNTDGPKGLGSTYRYGDGSAITLYVDQVVMSSTFNKDLSKERGELFAEDALYAGYSMIFGPGSDWHRTAFSGRNAEYYSEDGVMAFYMGASQVKAMQEGGLIAGIKHFVGNDMETNRHGVSTFSTEQAFREGSLRCFEGALRDDKGGALGTMTCFNRVGTVAGAGSYATQVQILRKEWGFKGVTITDSSRDASDYVHTRECLVNGTDMFNNDASRTNDLVDILDSDNDGQILQALRTANKHYYYAFSRSNLVNGLEHNTKVQIFVPWWKKALTGAEVVLSIAVALAGAAYIGGFVIKEIEKRKEEK